MKNKGALLYACLSFLFAASYAQDTQVDSLRKALLSATSDTARVHLLLALSKNFMSSSSAEAIAYGFKAKELAEKINFKKGLAYAYKSIGIGYYREGNHMEAFHNYEKSLAIFDTLGDKVGIANIQNNIGAIYDDERDDEKALEYYLESLKASEEAADTYRIATVCVNIGNVYGNQFITFDKALEYYKMALPLSQAIGDSENIANAYVNMGEIYLQRNEDTSALKCFFRSLKACNNSENAPYSLNLIGKVYLKRKDYESALKYHQQAYDFAKKMDAKMDMAQSLLGIANARREAGDIPHSIEAYKEAEAIATELKAYKELKESYEGLAQAYAARGDFSKAYRYDSLVTIIKDSLFSIDADKKLQGLQFSYDIEKKQTKISLLTKDNEIQQHVISRQKLVRNGFIGGFTAMLLFAGVFFMQRNRIRSEKERSEELLLNILPAETAEELKHTGTAKTKSFDSVTVLFTDFKNFTLASEKLTAEELVQEINLCYSEFDRIVTRHGIEKIKTIGDSYMCAGGLPVVNSTHPVDVVRAGLEMQEFMITHKNERIAKGVPYFELRLGIHSGNVVAGIVGIKKFAYDIWGDTVNTASRMESSGAIGKVNISGVTYELVKDKFICTYRGKIEAKNKGLIDMYFVEQAKGEGQAT